MEQIHRHKILVHFPSTGSHMQQFIPHILSQILSEFKFVIRTIGVGWVQVVERVLGEFPILGLPERKNTRHVIMAVFDRIQIHLYGQTTESTSIICCFPFPPVIGTIKVFILVYLVCHAARNYQYHTMSCTFELTYWCRSIRSSAFCCLNPSVSVINVERVCNISLQK